jgi:hypothetical protein
MGLWQQKTYGTAEGKTISTIVKIIDLNKFKINNYKSEI